MCSKRYKSVKDSLSDLDKSWEEEIERLKRDLKRAERKIFYSEQGRFADRFSKGCNKPDNDSLKSSNLMDLQSSSMAERMILNRKLSCGSPAEPSISKYRGNWVSPKIYQPKNDVRPEPFGSRPDSSFEIDCGSSVISLDFGLVSPSAKNWCSPPQRIERAQNREWSSPHRVIDRPSPENSPGNWISMKESAAKHSPTLVVKTQAVEGPIFTCPPPEPSPFSECTYIVPEQPKGDQPKRKTSVLGDYERVVSSKKRAGGLTDTAEINLQPTNDKVRRLVGPSGHVTKISLLDDFEAPGFGKTYDKTTEEAGEPNRRANKTTKSSKSPSRPQSKKPKEESKPNARIQSGDGRGNHPDQIGEEEKTKKEGSGEDKAEDITKSTKKMIEDLEEILRPNNTDKAGAPPGKEKLKEEKSKPLKKFKPRPTKPVEEKPPEPSENKRKRNVDDIKAVQEYIKSQKQKRLEQVKTEKEIKNAEREAKKKKLEELRIKTLKLAAQSKKKKVLEPDTKAMDPGTEDDVTVSLGLKQTKPKVSYIESVSKLKKKATQPKPQPCQVDPQTAEQSPVEEENPDQKTLVEEEEEKTLKNVEPLENIEILDKIEDLKKPEETIQLKTANDLNVTLKKLAETLHLKIDMKEKQLQSRPMSVASKSVKDTVSQVPSQETLRSVRSAPEQNRQLVSVDLETIQTLKSDIRKISENFKVLHEIIVDKVDLGKAPPKEQQVTTCHEPPRLEVKEAPDWLRNFMPRAYPYNVFSAFQRKMNLKTSKTTSSISQGSSTFAEPISNKYESEFEALSMPSDRLRSVKEIISGSKSTSCGTSEENYFSMKDDSGSEMSSSILDSEKQSFTGAGAKTDFPRSSSKRTASKSSVTSSIVTEISSRSIQMATSNSIKSKTSSLKTSRSSDRENLILVTPDIKLITNDLHQEKFNNYSKNLNLNQPEELNNSEKSYKEQKTDSTITEIIDNLSENEKSVKSTNEKTQNVVQRVEEVQVRRSYFQPEMLHLQFQAELTLLETFQQSLSHFLEAERMKTLSEVNKIVNEKTMNTERNIQKEDQCIQTSYLKDSPEKTTSDEDESVKTEINVEEESIKTEKLGSDTSEKPISEKRDSDTSERPISEKPDSDTLSEKPDSVKRDVTSDASEKQSSSSRETLKNEKETPSKDLETDVSTTGISFQMLNRMMKDEELRSEHQLALIRLREKTLNEKVKAELTFLEMKKRALKERGADEEQNISAIKKKQRGILLKYQSEKEEIERLKKMHRIASEERRIMIKQQKQIQQMQMSTNDMIIRLKKREKSPQKKSPLKPKAFQSSESQSEVPEDIPVMSDSILSESVYSAEESRHSTDLDLSSRSNISEDDSEIISRKSLQTRICHSLESFKSKKSQLEVEKYPRKRHSVEELLSWTKRLEEKENRLKELEKQTMNAANRAKSKLVKSIKASMKDRSTSPFQFQEKTISEVSPTEGTDGKKSSTISEAIEANPKTEVTEKTESIAEKIQSSASEDIPEQFSKKISTSRTEYYSESFESPSSSETPKTKPEIARTKPEWGQKSIAIKLSLSPRMQSPRRRYSSGSDESVNLSHTETASEQSDLESRIAALHEQLRKRKLEAERLRREQKKAQRERLKVKEQSLLKQIQAYDAYIQKKKQELEQEYENSNQTVMKPVIKQPKVAEKSSLKRQDPIVMQETEKPVLYPRLTAKSKEKDESTPSERTDKESDSEVAEQIKTVSENVSEGSESIKEQIGSKLEEEEISRVTESILEVETKESLDALKSSSPSESLPEQEILEGSQSESEDQSISVKTTLHSPEKLDTEIIDSATGEESQNRQTIDEDVYQFDSFESDPEGKVSESIQKSVEASEAATEIKSESAEEIKEEEEEVKEDEKCEKAEKVADSILMGLILESLDVFCTKKAEAEKKLAEKSKLSLEALSSYLAKEIIAEAVDDMITIYNRKDERVTTEVRKRINEIVSQDQKRPQNLAKPPEGTPEISEQEQLAISKRERKPQEQTISEGEEGSAEETKAQGWIDDDFGLSQTRREAEELRLQQLQIEQEIQQLQAQQEQVPYFYLREIPNKPPPPYTPPGKPLAEIPTSEADIMSIATNAVRILMEEMNKGKEIAEVEPTWDYYGDTASENLKSYKFFLFDLAKHLISDLIEQQEKKAEVLPWLRTREHLSKYKYQKIERTFECLNDFVQKQVSVLFGFGRRVSKESLIVKWIKKKRDHVDEILVGESQEEEAQWTRYDEDQVTVKNEVAMAILDGLLEETARVVNVIYSNKMKKEKTK